ncbi:hypothetical protein [Algoriphagus formosus]|uniref:hypothetical protein n=1 Tax=Algoriphagus formosus TaxID=2007308 RepID=UPI003F71C52E
MTLPRKLTIEEEQLRAELVKLEERIRMKIRKIGLTNQKLPYERLAKGRQLKELCLAAISYLDDGKEIKLQECLRALREKGLEI